MDTTTKVIPLCAVCAGYIGGAFGGPDCEWRPALAGEACGAADHEIETWTCADCPLDANGEHVGNHGPNAHAEGDKHEDETGHVVWFDSIPPSDIPTPSSRKDVR